MLVPIKALTCVANSDDIVLKLLIFEFISRARTPEARVLGETATSKYVGFKMDVTSHVCKKILVLSNRTPSTVLQYVGRAMTTSDTNCVKPTHRM